MARRQTAPQLDGSRMGWRRDLKNGGAVTEVRNRGRVCVVTRHGLFLAQQARGHGVFGTRIRRRGQFSRSPGNEFPVPIAAPVHVRLYKQRLEHQPDRSEQDQHKSPTGSVRMSEFCDHEDRGASCWMETTIAMLLRINEGRQPFIHRERSRGATFD